MSKELLRIRDLCTAHDKEAALDEFRLQAFEGELLGIIGLNGSGKSTLAKVLSGEIEVLEGTIKFDNVTYSFKKEKISKKQLESLGIYVIQRETKLIANLGILDNMAIASKGLSTSWLANPRKKERLIDAVLTEYAPELDKHTLACNLPNAIHSVIGILKAFMLGAKLIILDRILEYCSSKDLEMLLKLINRLREKEITFLVTYNKVAPFLKTLDRLNVVRSGQLVGILHKEDYSPDVLANWMTGWEFKEKKTLRTDNQKVNKKELLEVKKLGYAFELNEVSFTLYSGEIIGIYGSNQEATMTLFQLLSGAKKPDRGEILVLGSTVSFHKEHEALQRGIGAISEQWFDQQLFKNWNTGTNALLPIAKRSSKIFGYLPSRIIRYMHRRFPEEIGVSEISEPVQYLEKEQQFILAIHRCLLSGANILVLENPLQSADLVSRGVIYNKMDELCCDEKGIIFISGDFTELAGFCDKILIFNDKKSYTILEGLNFEEEAIVKTIL